MVLQILCKKYIHVPLQILLLPFHYQPLVMPSAAVLTLLILYDNSYRGGRGDLSRLLCLAAINEKERLRQRAEGERETKESESDEINKQGDHIWNPGREGGRFRHSLLRFTWGLRLR